MNDLIFELDEVEKEWWASTISEFRKRLVFEPRHYAKIVLTEKQITKEKLSADFDGTLKEMREAVWQKYLSDEAMFHTQVLAHLVKERELPKNILEKIVDAEILSVDLGELSRDVLAEKMAKIVGDYVGRVMPYIYALSLSTTNSRRSRAGTTFEHVISAFMGIFGYPYEDQSSIGTEFYKESNLGKKVDLLVPGAKQYTKNRAKCAIVTMKTTLRERWQEVAEELSRTNVPHIYLLTVDESITVNVINTMKRYNITVVVYGTEKTNKFSNLDNAQDFQTFFLQEMPHIIGYWKQQP